MSQVTPDPNLTAVVIPRIAAAAAAAAEEWPKCVRKGLFVRRLGMERVNACQYQQLVGDLIKAATEQACMLHDIVVLPEI